MADRYGAIREALPILIAEAQAKGGRNERAALIVELLAERDALARRVDVAGRPVGWFHASPDCTHFSQAKVRQQLQRIARRVDAGVWELPSDEHQEAA